MGVLGYRYSTLLFDDSGGGASHHGGDPVLTQYRIVRPSGLGVG